MAKKENPENGATVDVSELAAGAQSVQKFTEVWIGHSPLQLGMDPENKEKIPLDSLVGKEIVILGFSKRTGDKSPFVICTFTEKGGNRAKVLVTGAAIIVRKLDEVAAAGGFPVSGTIERGNSKTTKGGHYYNFR